MATAIFISCAVTRHIGHNSSAVATELREFSVLVVDDDPNIRRMIVAALRRDGYSFYEAPNGRDALDLMRDQHPNVVVLDLMMPVLSGWDVLRERQHDPELSRIPVIVVSANRDPDVAVAVNAGICAFLPKPFDIGALSALVKSCMPPAVASASSSTPG
jgi:two-component system KDP operon response regulator KdpE